MEELKKSFPEDIDYAISPRHDAVHPASRSTRSSTRCVEAIILVAIVVLVFLQNWRSALIPLVAVPVAIIGTFAVMAAIGFSLNNLTLFGLVLAIGIVVDDAIVVVEAVEHHIEHGMTPRQAANKAMEEVSGPVIAVALVLSAVFVPCAFISGITGQFFRQFALTIAVSTVISAFNSLTLSPALAALLLKPRGAKKDLLGRLLDFAAGLVLPAVQLGLPPRHRRLHARRSAWRCAAAPWCWSLYGGLLVLTLVGLDAAADRLHPQPGPGPFYIAVQLPDAASLERTQEVVDHIADIVQRDARRRAHHRRSPASRSRSTPTAPTSATSSSPSTLRQAPRSRRCTADAITDRAARQSLEQEVPEASVSIFRRRRCPAWARPAASRSSSRTAATSASPSCRSRPSGSSPRSKKSRKVEKLFTRLPRQHRRSCTSTSTASSARRMGVDPRDVFNTLQIYLGSLLRQRLQPLRPHLAGGRPGRRASSATTPSEVKLLKVRNASGEMVPLGRRPDRPARSAARSTSAATTCTPPPPSSATPSPASRPAQGIEEMERLCRRGAAAGHGVRVDRDQLHADRRRQERLEQPDLPAGRGVRVPGAGGAVRELGAAAGRHPRRADVHPRLADRRVRSRTATSTSSRRSASWCWSAWRARTPS